MTCETPKKHDTGFLMLKTSNGLKKIEKAHILFA